MEERLEILNLLVKIPISLLVLKAGGPFTTLCQLPRAQGNPARSITGTTTEKAEQSPWGPSLLVQHDLRPSFHPGPPPGPSKSHTAAPLLTLDPRGSVLNGDGEFSLSSASHSLDSLLPLRKHSSLFSFHNKHVLSTQMYKALSWVTLLCCFSVTKSCPTIFL